MSKAKPAEPIDFTYRYRPGAAPPLYRPDRDPAHVEKGEPEWVCVAKKLIEGNLTVVRYLNDCRIAASGGKPQYGSQVVELSDSDVLIEPCDPQGFPFQVPVALVLGCVDARAPAEIIFGMEFVNDVFNVRLAGNVVAQECLGSVEYALRNLVVDPPAQGRGKAKKDAARRMRLMVALGHEGCGAIAEAVRAYQFSEGRKAVATGPVAALLGHVFFPSLILAAEAYDAAFGSDASRSPEHFGNVCQLTSYLNAAWGAHSLQQRAEAVGPPVSDLVGVVYGVFDPRDMHVRAVPNFDGTETRVYSSFGVAPKSLEELRDFAGHLARAMRDPDNVDLGRRLLAHRTFASHPEA